jgi:malonyl-CoA/methylmalonyl-CoA synthetase
VVEASLMDLPYVADACVLGVPYHEARQLCGAVIKLRHDSGDGALPNSQVNLARIQADLAGVLAAYMLPVVLRILRDGEQLPRTDSGKPVKQRILREFLGTTKWFPAEDLPEDVEYCGCMPVIDEGTIRPWDWGGMQVAR